MGGGCNSFGSWAIKEKGPVFVSTFNPIGTVFSVAISAVTLGDIISLGRWCSSVSLSVSYTYIHTYIFRLQFYLLSFIVSQLDWNVHYVHWSLFGVICQEKRKWSHGWRRNTGKVRCREAPSKVMHVIPPLVFGYNIKKQKALSQYRP